MVQIKPMSVRRCLQCGALQEWPGTRCWVCREQLDKPARIHGTGAAEEPIDALLVSDDTGHAQFTLASLLLVVTISAVLMGVWEQSPGLGLMLTVAAVPALVATAVRSVRRRARGEPLSWGQQLLTFLVAAAAVWGMLVAMAVAAVVALFIFCLVTIGGSRIGHF